MMDLATKKLPPGSSIASPRGRHTGWLVAVAAAGALTWFSADRRERAEDSSPSLPSVARFRLDLRDGLLHRVGSTSPFTGFLTDHFEDGSVRLRSTVQDGRLHGVSEGWFADGALELREYFVRGQPHGPRATWHPNGRPRSQGQLVAGRQEGSYRQWHESGALAVEAVFENGQPHGLTRAWHPSGALRAEAMMHRGEIQVRHVYPDGLRHESTLLATHVKP